MVYEKSTRYVVKFRAQKLKLAIVFQHELLFNLVKDLFKWIEVLWRSVIARVQSERERIFDLGCIRKKNSIRCQISRSKTCYSVSTWIAFQPSQGLIQMNWGYREECHCASTVWEGKSFWPKLYTKKVLDTLSNFALKNSLYSVSHKLLFNLVKDLFKWIEGPGRSGTVRIKSEREII